MNLIFVLIYRPPPTTTNGGNVAKFMNEMNDLFSQLTLLNAEFFVVGDINLHLDDANDRDAKAFLELLSLN